MTRVSRTMVINDLHIPFHDSRLVSVEATGMIFDIAEDLAVDRILLNGDVLDCYNWNSYGIHPAVQVDMETELYLGRCFFENLRERFPHTELVFCYGNHEARFEKWVIEKCKPVYNILRLDLELGLERLGIEWYPYQQTYTIESSNVKVVHSPPSYSVNGSRASLLKKIDQTFLYGCTHREQKSCITGGSGAVYSAYFNGWLGSVDETPSHQKVFSYRKGHVDWQQCFSIVTTIDEVESHVNQISIRNHKCVVDGHLYDYSEEDLKNDLQYTQEL